MMKSFTSTIQKFILAVFCLFTFNNAFSQFKRIPVLLLFALSFLFMQSVSAQTINCHLAGVDPAGPDCNNITAVSICVDSWAPYNTIAELADFNHTEGLWTLGCKNGSP